MRTHKLAIPFLLGGGITLSYALLRQLLDWNVDTSRSFFDVEEIRHVQKGQAHFDLPIAYYRDDCFAGLFDAAYRPVADVLPTGLYPMTLPNGRAAIAVVAFNYLNTSLGSYGEVGISIPCTYQRQAPPLLPVLLEAKFPTFGVFVLHLPVTTIIARDAGRGEWGYPKFMADMDFEKFPHYQRVRLEEGGAPILTLTVQQRGFPIKDNRPLITYSILEGCLMKTTVPTRAIYQLGAVAGLGQLELGTHPVAEQLKSFDISPSAIFTKNYLSRCSLLPAGHPLGPVARFPVGYAGEERAFGRLTVSYAKGELIEVHPGIQAASQ